jgi:methionine biosynthesis protein MetW
MTVRLDDMSLDQKVIFGIIPPGSKVLDLGCGSGDLLRLLVREKDVKGQGIEIDESAIYQCVQKGLSVFHGNIESGLADYPDNSFDYVILNESLQQVREVDYVIKEALRVGRKIIVGVPNFAYIRARLQLFFLGRVPVVASLPYSWYETPNLRFLSLSDFLSYCRARTLKVEHSFFLGKRHLARLFPNLFARVGVFVVSR